MDSYRASGEDREDEQKVHEERGQEEEFLDWGVQQGLCVEVQQTASGDGEDHRDKHPVEADEGYRTVVAAEDEQDAGVGIEEAVVLRMEKEWDGE